MDCHDLINQVLQGLKVEFTFCLMIARKFYGLLARTQSQLL